MLNKTIKKITALILCFCMLYTSAGITHAEESSILNADQLEYETVRQEEEEQAAASDPIPSAEPSIEPVSTSEPEGEQEPSPSGEELADTGKDGTAKAYTWEEIPEDIRDMFALGSNYDDFSEEDKQKFTDFINQGGRESTPEEIAQMEEAAKKFQNASAEEKALFYTLYRPNYESLTAEEKQIFLTGLGVEEADLGSALNAELSLYELYAAAEASFVYPFSIPEMAKLFSEHPDWNTNRSELDQLNLFIQSTQIEPSRAADLFLDGYTARQIENAYVEEYVFGSTMEQVIESKYGFQLTNTANQSSASDQASASSQTSYLTSGQPESLVAVFSQKYDLSIPVTFSMAAESENPIVQKLLEYDAMKSANTGAAPSLSQYYNEIISPYQIQNSVTESISANDGSLNISHSLENSPLSIRYNSSENELKKKEFEYDYSISYHVHYWANAYYTVNGYPYQDYDKSIPQKPPRVEYFNGYNQAVAFIEDMHGYEERKSYGSDAPTVESYYTSSWDNTVVSRGPIGSTMGDIISQNPAPDSIQINDGDFSGSIPRLPGSADLISDEVVNGSDGYWTRTAVYRAHYGGYLYYSPSTYRIIYRCDTAPVTDEYFNMWNDTTADTYTEKLNHLGTGWSWNLPSIEIERDYKVLHLRDGEAYEIKSDLSLKDYTRKDKLLSEDTSYTAGQVASKYVLKYKDGSKIYFAGDGRLLAEMDRLGNTVAYEHTTINGFPVVNKITDPYGRVTNITYADTDGGRTVTVTNPDATATVITLTAVPNQTGEYVITKITDPIGRETRYEYSYDSAPFAFDSKSSRSGSNTCANLTKVTYPIGATSDYTYESVILNLGSEGTYQAYRIKTREDKIGTDSFNKKTYTYTNNPTGSPDHSDPKNLPSSFTYQVSVTDEAGLKQEYTFNNKHLNTALKVYDTTGSSEKLLSQTDNTYNSDKLLESQTSAVYNQTDNTSRSATESYTYDSDHYGDLMTYTNPYGGVTTYTYESKFHQVTSKVTPVNDTLNRTVSYTIDPATGNFTKMVDGDLTVEYLYDSRGNITKETAKDPVNNKTTVVDYEYASTYQGAFLTKKSTTVTSFDGTIQTMEESYEYDFSKGLLTKTIHPNGSFTTYTYDTIGRQTAVTPPQLGDTLTSTLTEYDDENQTTTVTDETGYKVRVLFDALGREIQKQEWIDNAWRTLETRAYNELSQLESITNALNAITQYEYDIQGRITKTTHPDNSFITATYYDGEGKTVTTSEDGAVTRSYTDLLGRTVKTEAVNGNTTVATLYEYDKAGNNTKVTDPKGNVTTNTYDAKSRLVKTSNMVDGEAVETVYTYDAFSNLVKVTDPMGNDTQSVYDELGRVIQNTDSLGKTEKTKYDAMGNPVQTVARSGIVTTYEYNPRGWLTKSTTGSVITEMAYDKAGRVTQKIRGDDSRLYEYYANGQLKKETTEDGKSIQYEYDALGRRTQMTDYFGQVFTYSYNNRDYLTGVSGLGKSVSYTRNPDGTVATKTMGNLVHSYHYDSLNQLTELKYITDDIPFSKRYCYSYDKNGNVLEKLTIIDDYPIIDDYTYDALNRLKISTEHNVTFTYDKNGNILSESTASAAVTYTYDANNRLIHKSAGTSFWDFSYDHDGNLIYKAQGTTAPEEGQETPAIFVLGTDTAEAFGDTATYQYNELGQLIQYLDLNGQTVTYTYGLNGLRSSKTVNGVTTKYYYDGDLVVNETDGTNLTATNLNGVQTEIRFTHEGETTTAAYFLYDGHGDVVGVLNETLDEIANYEYDIYGEEKSSTGTYDSPIRYTGQYYDAETGMYYLRARFYDPAIRRFISEDPAHDGRNWYAYCNGNPIKYWDPWGLEYGKIRDFVEDYRGAFKGKISIETRPGLDFAFITMGKYGKAFYYDGTISNIEFDDYGNIIKEERIKVADAIDGHLYMQRSAFVIAMGMVDGGDATVTVSDKFYVDDSLAMLDFASNIVSSSSNASDITSLYDLLGKAPALGKAVQLGATLYQLEEKIRKGEMMSTGYYRAESVVVKSPYFDIYSYQVDTLYGVDRNTSYYQWYKGNGFLWGWIPGGPSVIEN